MTQFRLAPVAASLLVSGVMPLTLQAGTVEPLAVQPYGSARERLITAGVCAGCDLRGARLEGAHLIGVDLRDADLRGADLREASSRADEDQGGVLVAWCRRPAARRTTANARRTT